MGAQINPDRSVGRIGPGKKGLVFPGLGRSGIRIEGEMGIASLRIGIYLLSRFNRGLSGVGLRGPGTTAHKNRSGDDEKVPDREDVFHNGWRFFER